MIFMDIGAGFLGAARSAEFKDCSLADGIVRDIVKLGFGYFNENRSGGDFLSQLQSHQGRS